MNLIKAVCVVLLSVIVFTAQAQGGEKLTGAFGVNFGALLKDVNVIESHVNGTLHSIEPPKPMSLLRLYTVETTGDPKKIYRIIGITLQNDQMACLEDLATIKAILQDKYGQLEQLNTIFRYKSGMRSVIASCDSEGGIGDRKVHKLKLTYEDRSMMGGADSL